MKTIRANGGKRLLQKEVFSFPTIPVDNFVGKPGTASDIQRHCDIRHILPYDEAKKSCYKSLCYGLPEKDDLPHCHITHKKHPCA